MDVEREECIHDGDAGCIYTAQVGVGAEQELVASLSG
jgi:hypothetical protein